MKNIFIKMRLIFLVSVCAMTIMIVAVLRNPNWDHEGLVLSILSIGITFCLGIATYYQACIQNKLDMIDKTPVMLPIFVDASELNENKINFIGKTSLAKPNYLKIVTSTDLLCVVKVPFENVSNVVVSDMSVSFKLGDGESKKEESQLKYIINDAQSYNVVAESGEVIFNLELEGGRETYDDVMSSYVSRLMQKEIYGETAHIGIKPNAQTAAYLTIPSAEMGGNIQNVRDTEISIEIDINTVVGYSYKEKISMKLNYYKSNSGKQYFNVYDYKMSIK